MTSETFAANEKELEAFGKSLAISLEPGDVIFLEGSVGAGKTTMARGILRGLGYDGIAGSPTYTLIETYDFDKGRVIHIDLYRIERTEDLEGIGLRDYFDEETIFLIEWPERMDSFLPEPDLRILLSTFREGRKIRTEMCKSRLPAQ